jgi:hypothetical protein
MHVIYKAVSFEDVQRILDYCRRHTVKQGGLFEVYPSPEGEMEMVVVNSCSEDSTENELRPLGAFYCNYSGPGVISIEEEDPYFDGMESNRRHVKAIKQVIDILLQEGYPGTQIRFNDLPALRG